MAPQSSPSFTCFSKLTSAQKHYHAAPELCRAGVWVGFLSAEKHRESYRGLPSFSELRLNAKKFNPPFPPPISGVAREERHAVCRGCLGDKSQLISLREMAYITKTKLVIMPLVSEGEDLFCILIPQPNDRSLEGVQSYRPYEIGNGNQGGSFSNPFMLLTLRNSSQVNGTLETIRTILMPPQTPSSTSLPSRSKELSAASRAPLAEISRRSSLFGEEGVSTPYEGMQTRGRAARCGMSSSQPSLEQSQESAIAAQSSADDHLQTTNDSSTLKRKPEALADGDESTKKRLQFVDTPASRPGQSKSASRDTSEPSTDAKYDASELSIPLVNRDSFATPSPSVAKATPNFTSVPPTSSTPTIIALDLTQDQARRIRFIWTIIIEDVECEFVRGLDECQTFAELLDLLRQDAEHEPAAIDALENAKSWRLLYQMPSGPKKAFNVRVGNEAAFGRFQDALAQSAIWSEQPGIRIDVQLEART